MREWRPACSLLSASVVSHRYNPQRLRLRTLSATGQFLLLPHRNIGPRFTSISRHTNI